MGLTRGADIPDRYDGCHVSKKRHVGKVVDAVGKVDGHHVVEEERHLGEDEGMASKSLSR